MKDLKSINNKFLTLEQAVNQVEKGSSITLSGFGHSLTPVAFIREMVKQKIGDLHLIGIGEAWAVDILAGANSLSKVWLSNFMFEGYGRCKNFSREVEAGNIEVEDFSHYGQISRFAAGAAGTTFSPVKSMLGTDLEAHTYEAGRAKRINCPFTEDEYLAVSAVNPDVAVIHASRADNKGNIQLFGHSISIDEQVRSSKKVIVTVEEIVPEEEISKLSEVNTIPGFLVDHIVEVPYGAHPTGMYKYYSEDFNHIDYYMELSKTKESFQTYLADYIYNVDNHWSYLEKIGAKHLLSLKADPFLGYQLPKERKEEIPHAIHN